MLKFIITQANDSNVVTVILNHKPVVVPSSDPCYAQVVELLKNPEATEADLENVIFAKQKRVEAAILSEGDFKIENGVVSYKDLTLPSVLSDRLLSMAQEGFDSTLKPLKMFVENVAQNPSFRVFQQLYSFISHGNMALTPDGCFLAYKKVRGDYRDIHSGKFDNSVGQKLSMTRLLVDDNPEQTCSSGLHVCSFEYLPHFGGSVDDGFHVMVCKVNPKDVVSVPVDYSNTKMRVCAYEVIAEVDDYIREDDNVLSAAAVSDGVDFKVFVVEVLDDDGDWNFYEGYARMSEAFAEFAEVKEGIDGSSSDCGVRVTNRTSGEVLESYEY